MSSNKSKAIHIVLKVNGLYKNVLTLKKIGQESVEVFSKGSVHNISLKDMGNLEYKKLKRVDKTKATKTQITVHPNLKSKIGSIGIHYKMVTGRRKLDSYAYITDVRLGSRLFPVYTSLGRNVSRRSLSITKDKIRKYSVVQMWENGGLNTKRDTLCYSIIVANTNINFSIPEDFPRNVFTLKYTHFQLIIVYWLFNQPTKLRGINYFETTDPKGKAIRGYEFHEILNFTNFVILKYLDFCPYLPKLRG